MSDEESVISCSVSRPSPDQLSSRRDPFAAREGKTLYWRNVNMIVSKGRKKLQILHNVFGEVPAKEILAIMGPSGAGKTSLLNILAGRVSSGGDVQVVADVRLNDYAVDPTNLNVRREIAFVAQDDSLQITATPKEAIRFSAKLRLPRSMSKDELDALTDRMIFELGLEACADTMIGGHLIKGISGGERKRTSVGVELVVKPALVFLDEPTSGLDSYSAMKIIKVLKKVAHAGSSVIFTIHQPASDVFMSFDNLLLMNKGRIMSAVPAVSTAKYFASRGHPVPVHFNPADWIMDVAQTVSEKQLEAEGFFPKEEQDVGPILGRIEDSRHDMLGFSKVLSHNDSDHRHVSFTTQVFMLIHRDFVNMVRNKKAMRARFALTIMMSIIEGIIFLRVGLRSLSQFTNVQSHFAAMILVMMLSMFGTAQPSLLAFPEERPVFLREYSTNHYSVAAYFTCRLFMEAVVTFIQIMIQTLITYYMMQLQMGFMRFFVILYALAMAATAVAVLLGCSVTDPKMGQEFLPVLFMPQILFSGLFIPTGFIPVWLRWAQYLCSLTYAVRLSLLYEFGNCAQNKAIQPNYCENLLQTQSVYKLQDWSYWLILISLFLFFRCSALFVLQRKAVKYF